MGYKVILSPSILIFSGILHTLLEVGWLEDFMISRKMINLN